MQDKLENCKAYVRHFKRTLVIIVIAAALVLGLALFSTFGPSRGHPAALYASVINLAAFWGYIWCEMQVAYQTQKLLEESMKSGCDISDLIIRIIGKPKNLVYHGGIRRFEPNKSGFLLFHVTVVGDKKNLPLTWIPIKDNLLQIEQTYQIGRASRKA